MQRLYLNDETLCNRPRTGSTQSPEKKATKLPLSGHIMIDLLMRFEELIWYAAKAPPTKRGPAPNETTRAREERGRGEGRREEGRRERATTASQSTEPMITRSGANVSRPMVLSSNTEFSESNDNDLHNSDDDFNASNR